LAVGCSGAGAGAGPVRRAFPAPEGGYRFTESSFSFWVARPVAEE